MQESITDVRDCLGGGPAGLLADAFPVGISEKFLPCRLARPHVVIPNHVRQVRLFRAVYTFPEEHGVNARAPEDLDLFLVELVDLRGGIAECLRLVGPQIKEPRIGAVLLPAVGDVLLLAADQFRTIP